MKFKKIVLMFLILLNLCACKPPSPSLSIAVKSKENIEPISKTPPDSFTFLIEPQSSLELVSTSEVPDDKSDLIKAVLGGVGIAGGVVLGGM